MTRSAPAASRLREARARALNNARRLALALESARLGAWDLDLLTDKAVRTLRHDQILGYKTLQKRWGVEVFTKKHLFPADREVFKRSLERAFATGSFHLECRAIRTDGEILWISARGRVYRDRKGKPVRMIGTVADITEVKRAGRALDASRRLARELHDVVGRQLASAVSSMRGLTGRKAEAARRILESAIEEISLLSREDAELPRRAKELSFRENEVLALIAEGLSNKEAANLLSISVRTVEKHRENLTGKLGLRGTAALTKYAISRRLIKSPR